MHICEQFAGGPTMSITMVTFAIVNTNTHTDIRYVYVCVSAFVCIFRHKSCSEAKLIAAMKRDEA